MRDGAYITALVTGFLDRYGDALHDSQSRVSPLKFLDKFLGLWIDACGFDSAGDITISSCSGTDFLPLSRSPLSIFPLVVCWSRQGQNALPVVELLLESGYQPGLMSV
jgi:hypothetical protein